MDTWGIIVFAVGAVLYFVSKRKPGFLFVAGVGLGIVIGAVWSILIVNRAIDALMP